MSKAEKILIAIGVIGIPLMAIPAWEVLEHQHLMIGTALAIIWMLGVGMVSYSVTRMLRDIGRAKRVTANLESERTIHAGSMADLQEELRKRQILIERQKTDHETEVSRLNTNHQERLEALKSVHAKNIKDARRTVIKSARWGRGGLYGCDQTAELQLLLDRDIEELRASTEFFPENYPGETKLLSVEYFSPFSGRFERHTFQEGDKIDFAKLAKSSTHL